MLTSRPLRHPLAVVIFGTSCLAADPAAPGPQVENSVVRITSTVRSPDLNKPWTKQSPRD